jgi:hypothetical protein
MQIVRTTVFTRTLKKLGASAADLEALEAAIAADPKSGDVIPGLTGARKIRFSMGGKGKRGGGRAIYVALIDKNTVYLLTAYAKSKKEDLSQTDKTVLKALIAALTG